MIPGDPLFDALRRLQVPPPLAAAACERAAILEYDAGLPRRDAEVEAQHQTLGVVRWRPPESACVGLRAS
jgi:hypothetical protein